MFLNASATVTHLSDYASTGNNTVFFGIFTIMIIRNIYFRNIMAKFEQAHAVGPLHAQSLSSIGLTDHRFFRAILASKIIVQATPDTFYLTENAKKKMWKRFAFIFGLLGGLFLVLTLILYWI